MPDETISTTPTTPPPAPASVPEPTPPPAAVIVVNGTKTERELELERDLQTERDARRKAEVDASYAQDKARRLEEIQSSPPPTAPRAKKKGWTLLHEEES
ncbi:MAG: hypothetical protein NT154_05550 [Verrucomicrobia bacterium]|nr:hypothetical protein [Verrucomicrobiota bacterium]